MRILFLPGCPTLRGFRRVGGSQVTTEGRVSVMRNRLSILVVVLSSVFSSAQQIKFRDITAQAGIHFTHNNGAFGKKYLPETMGPGCAFIDYENDGWPDILLVNGQNWPGHPGAESTPKLYHNNHDGTFTDVTLKAGLSIPTFGLGVAVWHA